jgi:capsular polysaccharide biosynthesis protein
LQVYEFLHLVRKAWLVVAVWLAVGGGAGLVASFAIKPVYTATTSLYVSVPLDDNHNPEALVDSSAYAHGAVASYAEAVATPAVLGAVAQELGITAGVDALIGKVEAEFTPDTAVLNIKATDVDPKSAAGLVNQTAVVLTRLATQELDPPGLDGASAVSITNLGPASAPPLARSGLRGLRGAGLGLIAGLGLGVVIAVVPPWVKAQMRPSPDSFT